MDKAHQQAQEARKANAEKRREKLRTLEQDKREIRAGLKAIIASEAATPAPRLHVSSAVPPA